MTLIRIGDRYINLDNVTSIRPVNEIFAGRAGVMQIEFVGADGEAYGVEWIEGHEAIALQSWLDGRASDVLRLYELEQAARNG